jgi:hypothetical protein
MFEKIGRLAETAATKVSLSRRGFLGRLGRGALTAAAGLGGLLVLSNKARAGKHYLYHCFYRQRPVKACAYLCFGVDGAYCGGCPAFKCCELVSKTIIGTC